MRRLYIGCVHLNISLSNDWGWLQCISCKYYSAQSLAINSACSNTVAVAFSCLSGG